VEADPCIPLEHRVQTGSGGVCRAANGFELPEVLRDVLGVAGDEHLVDAAEVLVKRRPADAGPLGDQAHRDAANTSFPGDCPGSLEDRRAYVASVFFDGVLPELRHGSTIRLVAAQDTLHTYVDTLSFKMECGMATGDDQMPSGASEHEAPPGMPTWVKYLLGALLAVILLAVLAMLVVGGDHGPGRHGSGMHSAPAGDGILHRTVL
jgi:hypothetical protein